MISASTTRAQLLGALISSQVPLAAAVSSSTRAIAIDPPGSGELEQPQLQEVVEDAGDFGVVEDTGESFGAGAVG